MKKTIKTISFLCMLAIMAACGGAKDAKAQDSAAVVEETQANVIADFENDPQIKVVDNVVMSENLPLVIDFYADWCGPCKQYAPTFDEVSSKYNGEVLFVRINVDNYEDIARQYNIRSIPTTVFVYPGGAVLGAQTGIIDAYQLELLVNQLIANSAGANMSL